MVQTVCMPAKFAALCSKLSENQKRIVQRRRLDRLLDVPSMPIQRMLVESLADNYNEIDRTFSIRGNVVPISTWDVYCILGLVDKGEPIKISKKQADPRLFDLYRQKGDTAITFKYLEERIPREEDEVHFSRMFVLYSIGTILAPSSKGYIGSNYLELVADVKKIEGLNWARFTLEHLLEHLALYKTSKRSGLAGNLALLQVWYFEHFQAIGDCFNYGMHEHPLIKNWPESKVMKRARLEGIKKFGAEKVVHHLQPNESKVRPSDDFLHQGVGEQYKEGVRQNLNEDQNCNDNFAEEDINEDAGDSNINLNMETMKPLFEKIPELATVLQKLVKLVGESKNPSASRKLEEVDSKVHTTSPRATPVEKMEKEETVNLGSDAEMDFSVGTNDVANNADEMGILSGSAATSKSNNAIDESSGTSDDRTEPSSGTSCHSHLSSGIKRKINFSPLVHKVKTRTNRQPSRVCKSPYTGLEHKRVSLKQRNSVTVDDVIKGLQLSDLEIAAITYVLEEIAIDPCKDLLRVGASALTGKNLKCLVRPVRENSFDKWLGSWVIDAYTNILNNKWNTDKKFAVSPVHTEWLQGIGKEWLKTGLPKKRCYRDFLKNLISAEMVFFPINTSNTHWWLCVLYPSRNEFQVLDSLWRPITYEQETRILRCGIHSILQGYMLSSDKMVSRWSNFNILEWDVVLKKNIPRQQDGCSCGIFTIKYMEHWNGSLLTSSFSQKDMETFRKKMPAELFLTPLNQLVSIKEHVLSLQNFDWTEF